MHGPPSSPTPPRKTVGLHIHLLVLVAAALLPMLVLGVLATWKAGEQSRAASLLRLQATATTLAEAVDQGIEGQVLQMQLLWDQGRLPTNVHDGSTAHSGKPLILDLTSDPPGTHLPTQQHARLLAGGAPAVSDVFLIDGQPMPWVAIAADALDGRHRIARLQHSNELINLAHRQTSDPGTALFALVDSKGRIAARSRDPERWLGKEVPDWDALQAVGRDHGHFRARTQEGQEVILSFQKLQTAPGWALVVGEPREGFEAGWRSPLRGIVIGGLIAFVLAVIAAQRLARRILRTVRALARRSQLVADGVDSVDMAIGSKVTEFQQLQLNLTAAEDALRQRARDARAMAAQLEQGQRRYRAVAEAGALVFWESDVRGAMRLVTGWGELTGLEEAAALGHGWTRRVHPEDLPAINHAWKTGLRQAQPLDVEFRLQDASGQWRWVRARGALVEDGDQPEWAGVIEDVHARRQAQDEIAYLTGHDPLTGLCNRAVFNQRVERAITQARRGTRSAVLYLDLDRFKEVNDSLGHPVGDDLLRQVATRLGDQVRQTDTLARLGGDEFALLVEGNEAADDVAALAARLVDTVRAPYRVQGHHVVIGTSLGIHLIEDGAGDRDRVLQNADMALYQAKSDGRGCFRFFEPAMELRMQQRRTLEMDLRQALEHGEFRLHYQPLVDLRTRTPVACEALLRWQHPQRGLLLPSMFMPLAAEIGLVAPLCHWMLQQACRDAAGWSSLLPVAVDVAGAQQGAGFAAQVNAALQAAGLDGSRLQLEISEEALVPQLDTVAPDLHQLRQAGVRIVMDGFGAGHSSLRNLRRFPFDKVKIDPCYMRDLADDEQAATVIQAMGVLCRRLGIATCVDGIETGAQLRMLDPGCCDEGQGPLFGAPAERPPAP